MPWNKQSIPWCMQACFASCKACLACRKACLDTRIVTLTPCHITHAWRSKAYLGACIVQDARLWCVGLNRSHIDDGTALLHVLHSMLCNSEVRQDVGVEGALQTVSANLLELLDLLVLKGSIVDQDVDAAPLLDGFIHYVPAREYTSFQHQPCCGRQTCSTHSGVMPVAARTWVQGYNTGLTGSLQMPSNLDTKTVQQERYVPSFDICTSGVGSNLSAREGRESVYSDARHCEGR